MAFVTTVDSGTVNFETVGNGEVDVYVSTRRLSAINKSSKGLATLALVSVPVPLVLVGSTHSVFVFVLGLAATIALIVFLSRKTKVKWFSLVPDQGVKFDGGQVAFSDIDTLVTITNGNVVTLSLNVRGKQVPIVKGSEAEISYIKQLFKEKSSVRFG